MYEEFQLMNNLLHKRSTPDGVWVPVSPIRMSHMIVSMGKKIVEKDNRIAELEALLEAEV